ncbi:SAM-dependent methyltransferase, partial [Pseudomonas syringae]
MLTQLPTTLQNLHLPFRLRPWDGRPMGLGPAPTGPQVGLGPNTAPDFRHPSLGQPRSP